METDTSTGTSEKPQTQNGAGRSDDEILAGLQPRKGSGRPAQTRLGADALGSSTSRAVVRECMDCGEPVEVSAPVFDGKPMFVPPALICRRCKNIRLDNEERAEQMRKERERAEEAEKRRARILDHLSAAGVNAWDHKNATLESFDTSDSGTGPVEAAREFVAEVKAAGKYDQVRGLYLFGDTGTGKSHLAAAVARELMLDLSFDPGTIVFDHALRLIGRIQRTYSSEQSADEVLDRRIKARVWILDDLGTENPSADVVRRLTEIFTERAMRPTLVTSNLAPDKLEGRHAEFYRISSRLGPRYFRTVQVRGTDRRFTVDAA